MARGRIGSYPWRDDMGHNGCHPPPARLQFRTRLPALNFQPGYPRRIFGAARSEFSGVHHLHFEGADRLSFQPGYF